MGENNIIRQGKSELLGGGSGGSNRGKDRNGRGWEIRGKGRDKGGEEEVIKRHEFFKRREGNIHICILYTACWEIHSRFTAI